MVLVSGIPLALAILTSALPGHPRAAVETLGVPCFLGGMSRGLLGRNHPLHIRQNRSAALKKADVVVLAGGLSSSPSLPSAPILPILVSTTLPS